MTRGSLADFMLAPIVSVGLVLVGKDFAALAAPPKSAGSDQRLTFTAQAVLLACHCAYRFNQFSPLALIAPAHSAGCIPTSRA